MTTHRIPASKVQFSLVNPDSSRTPVRNIDIEVTQQMRALMQKGAFAQAAEVGEHFYPIMHNDQIFLCVLAKACHMHQKDARAEILYKEALKVAPADTHAMSETAAFYADIGKPMLARELLIKAAELIERGDAPQEDDHGVRIIYTSLATSFAREGNLVQTAQWLDKAKALEAPPTEKDTAMARTIEDMAIRIAKEQAAAAQEPTRRARSGGRYEGTCEAPAVVAAR